MAEQDRELLERAARSVGVIDDATSDDNAYGLHRAPDGVVYVSSPDGHWDWAPLDNSADAMELAVKRRLSIVFHETEVAVHDRDSESASVLPCVEPYGNDPNAATRRAIVRCAASLAPV